MLHQVTCCHVPSCQNQEGVVIRFCKLVAVQPFVNMRGVIYIFDILLIAGLACIVSGFFLIGIVPGIFALGVGLIIMAVLVADAHTITCEIEIETEDKEDEDS